MINRLEHAKALMAFDAQYRTPGIILAGMDEVGRGPLAGNVVTACVVMPEQPLILWIDDSKKLSESRREKVFDEIMQAALYVGIGEMSPEEIEAFGKRGQAILKVSRRDLPVVMAEGMWGATTVATTMILAAQAGIEFFVTGGIGGVHRGAELTFDVSADLEELGRTNVTVICAGAKAILDLPKTLEVLETKGVPVLGYQTKELPAFYTRTSGLKVDYELKDALDAAEILAGEGIDAEVINVHTIKPIDREAVIASAGKTGIAVTVENHNVIGGLHSAVLEALALERIPVLAVGVEDRFEEVGKLPYLRQALGLTVEHVVETVKQAVSLK